MNECELYLRQGDPISYGAVILRGPINVCNGIKVAFVMSHLIFASCYQFSCRLNFAIRVTWKASLFTIKKRVIVLISFRLHQKGRRSQF